MVFQMLKSSMIAHSKAENLYFSNMYFILAISMNMIARRPILVKSIKSDHREKKPKNGRFRYFLNLSENHEFFRL